MATSGYTIQVDGDFYSSDGLLSSLKELSKNGYGNDSCILLICNSKESLTKFKDRHITKINTTIDELIERINNERKIRRDNQTA